MAFTRKAFNVFVVFTSAVLLVALPVYAAVPKKIAASKLESYSATVDELGKEVICAVFQGKMHPGLFTRNGQFFKPTASKVKKKLKALKARKERASGSLLKKLQRKMKNLKKQKKRHIAACTAGDPDTLLQPLSRAITDDDIRLLAEKAGLAFGTAEQGLRSLKSQGITAVVDEFMRVKSEASDFQSILDNWMDGSLSANTAPSFEGIRRAWVYAMQHGNNPYRERFALFLLGLWTAAEDVLTTDQAHLLRDYIHGNSDIPMLGIRGYAKNPDMRDMAIQMSKSAMMLLYLDNASNIASNPNENFARELFELFTTAPENLDGQPNYTESGDIVKAAAAITGWRVASGLRGFSPFDQDTSTFVLFEGTGYDCSVGGSGQEKLDRVVHCIFNNHPNVSIFYASELLKEYLTPEPPANLIRALAKIIEQNNFNLDGAMRTLLSSEVFYSDQYRNTVPKNSAEFAVEIVRTLGLPLKTDVLELWIRKMGMPLTAAPTVFWFPDTTWTSAPVKLEGLNYLSEIVEDDYSSDGWLPEDVLPAGEATATQVINHAASILGVTLTSDQRSQIEFFLNNQRNNNGSYTESPYDNTNSSHRRERGLGVYQILGTSIDFQMK